MNRIRTAVLAALMVCAVSLGAAGTASAQGEPFATPMSKKVTGFVMDPLGIHRFDGVDIAE